MLHPSSRRAASLNVCSLWRRMVLFLMCSVFCPADLPLFCFLTVLVLCSCFGPSHVTSAWPSDPFLSTHPWPLTSLAVVSACPLSSPNACSLRGSSLSVIQPDACTLFAAATGWSQYIYTFWPLNVRAEHRVFVYWPWWQGHHIEGGVQGITMCFDRFNHGSSHFLSISSDVYVLVCDCRWVS